MVTLDESRPDTTAQTDGSFRRGANLAIEGPAFRGQTRWQIPRRVSADQKRSAKGGPKAHPSGQAVGIDQNSAEVSPDPQSGSESPSIIVRLRNYAATTFTV